MHHSQQTMAGIEQLGFRGEVSYVEMMNKDRPDLTRPIVVLTTPRLILRTTTENDIPILQEKVFGDSDVMRYAFAGLLMAKSEAERFICTHFTFGDSLTGLATLTERPDGDVVGFAGLQPCGVLGADDFEIGFVLARQVWGRGIATEIGRAQLAFGFSRLHCGRLLALAEPRNASSIHILGKLGMRYLKDIAEPSRTNRSIFAIEAEQWRGQAYE